ncbi:hypothetical protein LTR17_022373 [Elasticomyces elasticus]|nr:hypothetical protein LTR17_022373 [Elasticomyces elasticus]
MAFKHLVRFRQGNDVFYGDLLETGGDEFSVTKLLGDPFDALQETDEILKTKEVRIVITLRNIQLAYKLQLLCPLEKTPLVRCIGLNYKTHAEEAKLPLPKNPSVFLKPADALAGPFDVVPTHPDTREMLDYEGELVIVMGKDAKNVEEHEALDYVLGFTAGNDVSARNYQLPDVSGGQFTYAKSFDRFAPIGHTITGTAQFPDPLAARITTKVNGVTEQDSNTNDLIFSVRCIISHLSRGTTLRRER